MIAAIGTKMKKVQDLPVPFFPEMLARWYSCMIVNCLKWEAWESKEQQFARRDKKKGGIADVQGH